MLMLKRRYELQSDSMKYFLYFLCCFLSYILNFSSVCAQEILDTANIDTRLKWKDIAYTGHPWVKNISHPYQYKNSLTNRHLYISPSHGRYFNGEKWTWQRPALFCTTEDLLSTSFVFPYLVPMLENAGAIVYTPRERDPSSFTTIVDNDASQENGIYLEKNNIKFKWKTPPIQGFRLPHKYINDSCQIFKEGTVRSIKTTQKKNQIASAQWIPHITQKGRYAVYVSYGKLQNAIPDAHYIIHHAGGESHFEVNQQIGAGTWVYLGTFLFDIGQPAQNSIILTNFSRYEGEVSADAVKIGGGTGIVERSNIQYSLLTDPSTQFKINYQTGKPSYLPRQLEAARYYAQFSGLSDTLYSKQRANLRSILRQIAQASFQNGPTFNLDSALTLLSTQEDYRDDIRTRSHLLNYLSGGSVYLPDTIGAKVPFELAFALHTDAGYTLDNTPYGILGIATNFGNDSSLVFRNGINRAISFQLTDIILQELSKDITQHFHILWPIRGIKNGNYGETRSPQIPSIIVELLSHQNYGDMRFAHDPNFKFLAARSIYKGLLRYMAQIHGEDHIDIQPLPVSHFCLYLNKQHSEAILSWKPTNDSIESNSVPTDYIVYTAIGNQDWDNGKLTKGKTSFKIPLSPGVLYKFRVCALNKGGQSFPSEILTAYCPLHYTDKTPEILLVHAFDRLSGPIPIENNDSLGFDLNKDIGVPYEATNAFTGSQKIFTRNALGHKNEAISLGISGEELVGKTIAGNRLDGTITHAEAIIRSGLNCFIASTTASAFSDFIPKQYQQYDVIDYIAGLQKDVPYNLRAYYCFTPQTQKNLTTYKQYGGKLFISGSFVGSDMQKQNKQDFLQTVLHLQFAGQIDLNPSSYIYGLDTAFPIYNTLNAEHFACKLCDILEATNQSFPICTYGKEGYSAGVAYANPTSPNERSVVLGFPFECIRSANQRAQLIGSILRFLLE